MHIDIHVSATVGLIRYFVDIVIAITIVLIFGIKEILRRITFPFFPMPERSFSFHFPFRGNHTPPMKPVGVFAALL